MSKMNIEKSILLSGIILVAQASGDVVDAEVRAYLDENYPNATLDAAKVMLGQVVEILSNPDAQLSANPLFPIIDNLLGENNE